MDKKLQIIIIAVILALFLSLVALAVYQQKKINDLKRIIFPETGAGQAGSLGSKGQNQNVIPLAVAEQKRRNSSTIPVKLREPSPVCPEKK